MTRVLRNFLIAAQGNQLAIGGYLQGNVVSWLGAHLTPQGIVLGTVCEQADAPKPTSGLILPAGRAPAAGEPRWLFQVVGDGSPVPPPAHYKRQQTLHTGKGAVEFLTEEPMLAGFVAGLYVYVLRDRSQDPGVEVVKEA